MNENTTGGELNDSDRHVAIKGSTETGARWMARAADRHSKSIPQVVVDANVSGGAYAPSLATSGTRSTGAREVPSQRRPRAIAPQRMIPSSVKHACQVLFSACIDNLDRALDHDQDFFLRNNALEKLRGTLSDLWSRRAEREESFAEIVNMLQGILLQRSVEDFSIEQLSHLRKVLEKVRTESVFDDNIANSITLELLNGGIDAFREID